MASFWITVTNQWPIFSPFCIKSVTELHGCFSNTYISIADVAALTRHAKKLTEYAYKSLQPFVWNYPGEPIPEVTITNSHLSWSSAILYQLSSSTMIHSILPVQLACLTSFCTTPLQSSLAWHPPLHTPYISSTNHCLLFATHAHSISTCLL